ncbi:MAG: hypothetical protein SFX74_02825 [Fimbriimonadaceae bacterium]|nr:hypothetical protein [Fimbriimonadaceae bacterium]
MHSSFFGFRRSVRGTTLVEILVVIVVLLVGILAVVQIFPRGFQLLTFTRKNSMASALSRDEIERLKASVVAIPDAVISTDATAPDRELGLMSGLEVTETGEARQGGTPIGPWVNYFGANRIRQVIGEMHPISGPRRINRAGLTGCLVIPALPSLNGANPETIRSNDLNQNRDLPSDLFALGGNLFRTGFSIGAYDYLLEGVNANAPAIYLPTGTVRAYAVSLVAQVNRAGQRIRIPLNAMRVDIAATPFDGVSGQYPYFRVDLATLATANLPVGDVLVAINTDSIRVNRIFRVVPTFTRDPFEVRLLGAPSHGILVNTAASSQFIPVGDRRTPLAIKFDYTVSDWRVLRSDFRIAIREAAQLRLPITPIRVTGAPGPDGLLAANLPVLESNPTGQTATASHFAILDLESGGIVMEANPSNDAQKYVTVNKSTGLVEFADVDASTAETQIRVLFPGDATPTNVNLAGRALRAYYMARDEWAVQFIKPAGRLFRSPELPSREEFYVGGSNASITSRLDRIYFAPSLAGHQVSLGTVRYLVNGVEREANGVTVKPRADRSDLPGLAYAEIGDFDANVGGQPVAFNLAAGEPVLGAAVRSITVRSMWNPDVFRLTADTDQNAQLLERFARGYRRSTVQSVVDRGEVAQ